MSRRGDIIRMTNDFVNALDTRAPDLPIYAAKLGDGSGGDIRTTCMLNDDPADLYVRIEGRGVFRVKNTIVPPRHDLPVLVGPTNEDPDNLYVRAIDWAAISGSDGYPYVIFHHKQHEFGISDGGDDVVWVNKQQFLPFLGRPTDPVSTDVYVYAGLYLYQADWRYFPGANSGDLTAYNPAAGMAKYILLSINGETNVLTITDGTAFSPFPPTNPANNIPQCPAKHFPVVAVYLTNTTTEIDWPIMYDVRLMVGGGVNTTVPGPHNFIDTVVHTETEAHHAPVRGDLIVADGTPEWADLPIGADGRILRSNGTDPLWAAFDWDWVSGAAGADMVHYHSSNAEGGTWIYDLDRFGFQNNDYDLGNAVNIFTLPWRAYRPIVNAPAANSVMTGIQTTDTEFGSILLVHADEDSGATDRVYVRHRGVGDHRDAVLAGNFNAGDEYLLGHHPIMFIRSEYDNKWYELGWSGMYASHNLLSTGHGDTDVDDATRGSIIIGVYNLYLDDDIWDELVHPGALYHLQTDGTDVYWNQNLIMDDSTFIGLGSPLLGRLVFEYASVLYGGKDELYFLDCNLGLECINPNLTGAGTAFTIQDPSAPVWVEFWRSDDLLYDVYGAAMVGGLKWYAGVYLPTQIAQLDAVVSDVDEDSGIVRIWTAAAGVLTLRATFGGSSMKVGTPEGDDYTKFDDIGLMELVGDARVYSCKWIGASGIGQNPAKAPQLVKRGTGAALEFTDGNELECVFNMRLPEDMDSSHDAYLIVGWDSPTISQDCDWEFEYTITAVNDDVTAGPTRSLQQYCTSSATANGLRVCTFTVHNGDMAGIGQCIHGSIQRDGNDPNDTLGASAFLEGICLRYVKYRLGTPI